MLFDLVFWRLTAKEFLPMRYFRLFCQIRGLKKDLTSPPVLLLLQLMEPCCMVMRTTFCTRTRITTTWSASRLRNWQMQITPIPLSTRLSWSTFQKDANCDLFPQKTTNLLHLQLRSPLFPLLHLPRAFQSLMYLLRRYLRTPRARKLQNVLREIRSFMPIPLRCYQTNLLRVVRFCL